MDNEKNGKGTATVIIILILVILGLGGFIVYDKFISQGKEKNKDSDIKLESKDYDLASATNLVDKYAITMAGENVFENGLNDSIKAGILINNTKEIDRDSVSCDEIYGKRGVEYDVNGYQLELSDNHHGSCSEMTEVISYENANKTYKELFGTELKKEDLIYAYNMGLYDYDELTDKFIMLSCECGYAGIAKYIYTVKSATEKDNILTVKVGYIKLAYDEDSNGDGVYAIIDGEKKIWTEEETYADNFDKEFIEKYASSMTEYTFTFEKSIASNYVLTNVSK